MTPSGLASIVGTQLPNLRAAFPIYPPVEGVVIRLNVAPVFFNENFESVRGILPNPIKLLWVIPGFLEVLF